MTHVYGWLAEQSAEDALHADRLLFIEERPFQRVTRRLLGEDTLLRHQPKQLPSPPPEGEEEKTDTQEAEEAVLFARRKFREDVLVDFAALESSITRIQLIQSSNERERQRYAAEKAKILATSQAVRDNTAQLREQLIEAQRVLQLRKGYDTLAAKILDNKELKSREEARQDIAALEKDIAELEAEGRDADEVWETRQQGFEELVAEGKAFIRAIKGIKEQTEDAEIMDERDEGNKLDSTVGTPRPDGITTPRVELGGATPLPESADDQEHNVNEAHQPSKLRESDVIEPPTSDDAIESTQIDAEMDDAQDPAVAAVGTATQGQQTSDDTMDET